MTSRRRARNASRQTTNELRKLNAFMHDPVQARKDEAQRRQFAAGAVLVFLVIVAVAVSIRWPFMAIVFGVLLAVAVYRSVKRVRRGRA